MPPRTRRRYEVGSQRILLAVRLALLITFLATLPACRSQTPPPAPQHTPAELVVALRSAHKLRDYETLRTLILRNRAAAVVQFLLAVDRFEAANEKLRTTLERASLPTLASAVDLHHLTRRLDLFSSELEVVDIETRTSEATVIYSVANELPLRRATLVRSNGDWRYDPGPGDLAQLSRAFDALATGLLDTHNALATNRFPTTTLRRDPEPLLRELETRLAPGLKLLPAAPTSQKSDAGD